MRIMHREELFPHKLSMAENCSSGFYTFMERGKRENVKKLSFPFSGSRNFFHPHYVCLSLSLSSATATVSCFIIKTLLVRVVKRSRSKRHDSLRIC